jgi:hypothetical protein
VARKDLAGRPRVEIFPRTCGNSPHPSSHQQNVSQGRLVISRFRKVSIKAAQSPQRWNALKKAFALARLLLNLASCRSATTLTTPSQAERRSWHGALDQFGKIVQ